MPNRLRRFHLAPSAAAEADRPLRSVGRVAGFRLEGELPGTAELGLSAPEAVAVDRLGRVLIADTGNHRVLVVADDGVTVDELGGYGWEPGQFDTPSDVCVYEGFYTYVLDEGNRRVALYDIDGDFIDLVVGEGEAGSPVAIAVGAAGELLLVDSDSQSVLAYSQFDEKLAPVGRFGLDAGGLIRPLDVAVGPSREIAVADAGTFSVKVFDEFGAWLFAVSAPDTILPFDVAFDSRGNLFVADARHARVVAFAPGGGRPSATFACPGGFRPDALAVTPTGRLIVLDGAEGRILFIETVYEVDVHRTP